MKYKPVTSEIVIEDEKNGRTTYYRGHLLNVTNGTPGVLRGTAVLQKKVLKRDYTPTEADWLGLEDRGEWESTENWVVKEDAEILYGVNADTEIDFRDYRQRLHEAAWRRADLVPDIVIRGICDDLERKVLDQYNPIEDMTVMIGFDEETGMPYLTSA